MFANIFNAQDKTVLLTRRLLQLLHVQVTNTTINNTLLNHPDYPSLLSISDALRTFKVNNAAARIPKEGLPQLHLPFVAHGYGAGGERFMLVTAVADSSVQYIQDDGKRATATKDEFIKIWSGVALMAERGEASGEKNYVANKHKENIAALKLPAIVLFGLLILVAAAFTFYKSSVAVTAIGYLLLLLFYFAGIAVTALLLWYEIDKANPALQKICTAGAIINCSAILGSQEAKLFYWLSWSEVGFFYFAANFILLLIAGFTHSSSLLSLVVLLNIFALPYTVFSIYYQWRVAKQWCIFMPLRTGIAAVAIRCCIKHRLVACRFCGGSVY